VIEALEIAARDARDDNRIRHARALDTVREKLVACMTPRDALRRGRRLSGAGRARARRPARAARAA
jgi:hypothetical protein